MPAHEHNPVAIFGEGFERDPITGRPFEVGSGALPHDQQAANFLREQNYQSDLPKMGERCAQTGREYMCGSGTPTKAVQTRHFLSELSPDEKAQRTAPAAALHAATPAGQA
jgi:hypothetical protein